MKSRSSHMLNILILKNTILELNIYYLPSRQKKTRKDKIKPFVHIFVLYHVQKLNNDYNNNLKFSKRY